MWEDKLWMDGWMEGDTFKVTVDYLPWYLKKKCHHASETFPLTEREKRGISERDGGKAVMGIKGSK